MDAARIGSLKARYHPLGLVAQGQFGKVYCALHKPSGRLVALKLLDRQRSTTSQFLRELATLLSLHHPHLNQLKAVEQTEDGRCLVLDYCAGGTLRQLLNASTALKRSLLMNCLVQVLEGLGYAHDRDIIHCDVKPENILMEPTAGGWKAHLTDFGIAYSPPLGIKPAFAQEGSPAYMAPERFKGEVYPVSDLYAVGIILHEILLGDRPSSPTGSGNSPPSGVQQLCPASWQHLPFPYAKLLNRALAPEPSQRFSSAQTMAEALLQALEQHPLNALEDPSLFEALIPNVSQPWPPESQRIQLATIQAPQGLAPSSTAKPPTASAAILESSALNKIITATSRPGQFLAQTSSEATEPQPMPPLLLWIGQGHQLQALTLTSASGQGTPSIHSKRQRLLPQQHSLSITAASPITHLAFNRYHGFIATATSLHCWPCPTADIPSLKCIYATPQNEPHSLSHFALSPQGNWAGLIQRSPYPSHILQLLKTATAQPPQLHHQLPFPLSCTPIDLKILDRRHGLTLVSDLASPAKQTIRLFHRRGQWMHQYALPIPIKHWVQGTSPFELWAIEADQPQTLLRLWLKPYRLKRIAIAIVPEQVCPLPWGCAIANQMGQLLLLNQEGQSLGQLQIPLPTKLLHLELNALCSQTLTICLQHPQGIDILKLNLNELGLPLIF